MTDFAAGADLVPDILDEPPADTGVASVDLAPMVIAIGQTGARYYRMVGEDDSADDSPSELRPFHRTWVVTGGPDITAEKLSTFFAPKNIIAISVLDTWVP